MRRVDFLRPRRKAPAGWVVLVLGVASLLFVFQLDRRWAAESTSRADAAAAALADVRKREELARRPVTPTPDQRRMAQIAPQLRQPWLPVLRTIETVTRAPVYLLALSIDPSAGAIRLDAEADTFTDVLDYTRALDVEGVLALPELRSHEQVVDPAGRSVVRFTVTASWVAP